MSNLKHVKSTEFESEVLQSESPVLVDFYAEWCGPCKMLGPVLEELAADLVDRVNIVKVNIDEEQALTAEYGISAVPTLILFKEGAVVESMRGFVPKKDLKKRLEQLIAG